MIILHVDYYDGPGVHVIASPHVPEKVRDWAKKAADHIQELAAAEREGDDGAA